MHTKHTYLDEPDEKSRTTAVGIAYIVETVESFLLELTMPTDNISPVTQTALWHGSTIERETEQQNSENNTFIQAIS